MFGDDHTAMMQHNGNIITSLSVKLGKKETPEES
jgi:hypothetical protein